jgi:two-component system chemotaxis sensor kinase CheA
MNDFALKAKQAFLDESGQMVLDNEAGFVALLSTLKSGGKPELDQLNELFRFAHNLKGGASLVGFDSLAHFVHGVESILDRMRGGTPTLEQASLLMDCFDQIRHSLDQLKESIEASLDFSEIQPQIDSAIQNGPSPSVPAPASVPVSTPSTNRSPDKNLPSQTSDTVRVSLDKLESLIKGTGELLVMKSVFSERPEIQKSLDAQILFRELDLLVHSIYEKTMRLRMAPIEPLFQSMSHIVRETSKKLGKSVELKMTGLDTELDRTVLERLADPLMHLVRNAIDHGIEEPASRLLERKSETGVLELSARQDGKTVLVEIRDDGKGIDHETLVAIAIEKGLLPKGSSLRPEEAYQLIFLPGFSTKTTVSEVSGRGVGMDVVQSTIQKMQGKIVIQTEIGKGTCFTLHLPMTLAVLDGLVVESGTERYIFPCAKVTETVRTASGGVTKGNQGGLYIQWKGLPVPAFRLDELLGRPQTGSAIPDFAIVTRDHLDRPVSLLVDNVIDQQQVVVQKLDQDLEELPWVVGGAILSDGQPTLILSLGGILGAA